MPNIDERWLHEAAIQVGVSRLELLSEEFQKSLLIIETLRTELLHLKELDPARFTAPTDTGPATEP
jgi:hypothetical protein